MFRSATLQRWSSAYNKIDHYHHTPHSSTPLRTSSQGLLLGSTAQYARTRCTSRLHQLGVPPSVPSHGGKLDVCNAQHSTSLAQDIPGSTPKTKFNAASRIATNEKKQDQAKLIENGKISLDTVLPLPYWNHFVPQWYPRPKSYGHRIQMDRAVSF